MSISTNLSPNGVPLPVSSPPRGVAASGDHGPDGRDDGGLHGSEGLVCYACGVDLHAKDWTRRGPQGTRHDVCP